jgi:hypothetical protein
MLAVNQTALYVAYSLAATLGRWFCALRQPDHLNWASHWLFIAVICDIIAAGSYIESFLLANKEAERSSLACGILGGALLTAGTLCAVSVAGLT